MLHISIVDDDYRIVAQLTDILRQYYGAGNYTQEDYSNGLEFEQALRESHPDIVFMDIEMEPVNGEEAVRKLRETDVNENVFVIFISSHTEQLAPLFSLHPFDFLVKPVKAVDVTKLLDKIKARQENRKRTVSLVIGRKEVHLPAGDIMWIQSEGHRLEIRTCTEEVPLYHYGKLNDLYSGLEEISPDFLRIHASYVVNRKFITKFTQDTVFIQEKEFPISKKYRAEITLKIHEGI